jgi:hypothetical protein
MIGNQHHCLCPACKQKLEEEVIEFVQHQKNMYTHG